MRDYKKLIIPLIEELRSKNILKSLSNLQIFKNSKIFLYSTILQNFHTNKIKVKITASGLSFLSNELGLLKCLEEGVERISGIWDNQEETVLTSYATLKKSLNPNNYLGNEYIRSEKLFWVNGYNLTKKCSCFIPAQLVYQEFNNFHKEPLLSKLIYLGSGKAVNISHEATLLSGIYELVERDAFMTGYLNNIKPPRIDISTIKNNLLTKLLNMINHHQLEIFLFDITNDLEIPSFLSILVDKNNKQTIFSAGLKSNLSVNKAILGSIEESIIEWALTKKHLNQNKEISSKTASMAIKTRILTSNDIKLYKLYINNDKTYPLKEYKIYKCDQKKELFIIISLFAKTGFEIFYKDLTPNYIRRLNLFIYKAIIPKLQPLFLKSHEKEIRLTRINKVLNYFSIYKCKK